MNLNRTKTALATAAVLGALFSTAVLANAGGIERRDAINKERIEQGIRSGQITPREAARLRAKQARIERMEAHARRDGVLTEREKGRIEVAQNDLSRNIRHEKHDGQTRR